MPLSQTQKAVLEDHFLTNHYPTREEKTALGQRINLTGDKVHKWSAHSPTLPHHLLCRGGRASEASHTPSHPFLSVCIG